MQEPCQRFRHEQMRYPSLGTREFNHKIFIDPHILIGARFWNICTNMVHSAINALF